MKIGCPTEIKPQEFRVGMTPNAAQEAVAHGHERGVVHRALAPGNILVNEEGRAKVLAFGVAGCRQVNRQQGAQQRKHLQKDAWH